MGVKIEQGTHGGADLTQEIKSEAPVAAQILLKKEWIQTEDEKKMEVKMKNREVRDEVRLNDFVIHQSCYY